MQPVQLFVKAFWVVAIRLTVMASHQTQSRVSPGKTESLATEVDLNPKIQFSKRELEVLRLIVQGCSNTEIASALYLSPNTIKHHVRSILNKFGVDYRIQAAVLALRLKLI
jgi:DNA-binding NarL/FixJ family response regulator